MNYEIGNNKHALREYQISCFPPKYSIQTNYDKSSSKL